MDGTAFALRNGCARFGGVLALGCLLHLHSPPLVSVLASPPHLPIQLGLPHLLTHLGPPLLTIWPVLHLPAQPHLPHPRILVGLLLVDYPSLAHQFEPACLLAFTLDLLLACPDLHLLQER